MSTVTVTMMMKKGQDPLLCVEDDDDSFFESRDRMSTAVPLNLHSLEYDDNDDEDDDYDDCRISFASAVGGPADSRFSAVSLADLSAEMSEEEEEYNVWMAEPISIEERRRRLLAGMGLSKELIRVASSVFSKAKSLKVRSGLGGGGEGGGAASVSASAVAATTAAAAEGTTITTTSAAEGEGVATAAAEAATTAAATREEDATPSHPPKRSRSHGVVVQADRGEGSGGVLRRSNSAPSSYWESDNKKGRCGGAVRGDGESSSSSLGCAFKIKDLDTGKEFVIKELREDGSVNGLRETETGKQLTMEEFEKRVGYSPIVNELMRRVHSHSHKQGVPPLGSKSSKKKNWLKNIRGVANSVSGLISEWEKDNLLLGRTGRHSAPAPSSPHDWMKVHHHGKSYKEFMGLYMCQEIQAHQGSIWTIRFSPDAQFLASAGEDRVIRVWQVLDSDELPSVLSEEGSGSGGGSNSPQMSPGRSTDRPPIPPPSPDSHLSKKRGKPSGSSRRGSSFRENVHVPTTIFSLSEQPHCTFEGHLDDVLDLSWSKSQHLLSSSMDKTVRLWDMETKTCLKLFAHNDYVTCIQFNPIDDQYFISGSLDAKVRIWSIPDRQVIDWTDLHEMVTSACYTPDGKGALVGSHKGSCRFYDTSDYKLIQTAQIDIQPKKKKSNPKKITGFQFSPENPSEVMVTSADSQIRVFDGVDLVHKFRGFKNTSSQISASFTPDGRYVVCASEDSQVYIWKREEFRNVGGSVKRKGFITTRSYEHFYCKDVSVAIPWPGSNKYEPPLVQTASKKQNHHLSWKRKSTQQATTGAPSSEDGSVGGSSSGGSHRSLCPPLPKKSFTERTYPCLEEELANPSRTDSGIGSITSSPDSSPARSIRSSTISSSGSSISLPSPWRWYDSQGSMQAATAWGLAIVTAGLGGEIRTYQNFGLPVRLNRPPNLF